MGEYQKKNSSDSANLVKMLRLSAKYKLDSGNPEAAAKLLEEIHQQNPDDVAVLAELIGAYSSFDEAKAAAASSKLHPLKNLPRVSMSKKLNNGQRQQLTRRLPSRKLKKRLKMKRRLLMKPVTRKSKRRPRRSENQDFLKIWTD